MTAWASASSESRSRSELGLLFQEQSRQARNANGIAATYMSEKDARSGEKEGTDNKIADKELKLISSEKLRSAAQAMFLSAIVGAVGTVAKITTNSVRGGGVDWLSAIPQILNAVNDVVQKWLDMQKQEAEVDAVNEELGRLNDDRMQMAGHVAALQANPYI
jgi:hypothetical protein